jgi:hypothetical protein
MNVNIVNNFYKPGPATPTGSKRGRIVAIDKKINLSTSDGFYPINNVWGKFFIEGNVVDASTSAASSDKTVCNNATANNWDYGAYNQFASQYGAVSASDKANMKMATPFGSGSITTHTAAKAYEKVIAYAGASLSRDSHDARVVSETTNGTATFKGSSLLNVSPYPKWGIIDSQNDTKPTGADETWSAWPTLVGGTAPVDTDGDGMPDDWEAANGLDAASAADGKLYTLNADYTNLEVYLNGLVAHIVEAQNIDGVVTGVRPSTIAHNAHEVVVFPNPVKDRLRFDTSGQLLQIEIGTFNGTVLRSLMGSEVVSQSIDFSSFAKGMYWAKFLFADGTASVVKILK